MSPRNFFTEYWKPLIMTIIPTIILTGFTTFMTVKIAIAQIQVEVKNNKDSIKEVKHEAEIYQNSVYELQKDCQYVKGYLGVSTTRGGSN